MSFPSRDDRTNEMIASSARRSTLPKRQAAPEPFHWLKYGEKLLRDRKTVRTYYRCSLKGDTGCEAKKMVDVVGESPTSTSTHYRDTHNHPCGTRSTGHRPILPRGESPGPHLSTQQSDALALFDAQQCLRPSHAEELASIYAAAAMERDLVKCHPMLRPAQAATDADARGPPAAGPRSTAEALLLEHILKLHLQSSVLGASRALAQPSQVASLQQASTAHNPPVDICPPQPTNSDSRGRPGPAPSAAAVAWRKEIHPKRSEDVEEMGRNKRARSGDPMPHLGIVRHSSEETNRLHWLAHSPDFTKFGRGPGDSTALNHEVECSQGISASSEGGRHDVNVGAMKDDEGKPSLTGLKCRHGGCSWLSLGEVEPTCECFSL